MVLVSDEAKRTRRAWLGGYVREGKKGGVYVIERWIGGQHFHLSTRCKTERAALAHLAAFEADPHHYDPRKLGETEGPLAMTATLILEHENWQRTAKKNTEAHIHDSGKYLEAWLVALHGRDLRTVRASELKEMMARWKTAKRHRVIAIKGFYRWLRQEKGLLKHAEDPSLDMQIPAFRPAKLHRKRAVEFERVQKALSKLSGEALDAMRVLVSTGMHVTELERFAADGELFPPTPEQVTKGVLSNLAVKHKGGQLHIVAITDPETLMAAQAIKGRGRAISRSWLADSLNAACDAAGVERFGPGVMRHSVATWLAMDGVPLPAISDMLGHRSTVTTAKFYRDMGHTAIALPTRRLRLVKS